jgi:hypothetical protein
MAIEKALYEAPQGVAMMDAADDALEIEIVDPESVTIGMGDMEIVIEPGEDEDEFGANLAEELDDDILAGISDDLLEAYDTDLGSRADWENTLKDGLELLGLKIEDRNEPWEGAFGVYHPLLAEAVVKFQSETIVETFPPQGPVKTIVLGEETREKNEAAARVREDMNYQLVCKMTDYRSEHERMLWNLPIAGSAFKKTYYDPSLGRPVSQFVPAEDFVVSYGASDLTSAQRYTHKMKKSRNEVRKMQVSGFYRDVEMGDPVADRDDIADSKDSLGGYTSDSDDRYTLLEVHCELDLEGFEDEDKDGNETGIELPYIVTIDKGSNTVLSIYRNWREDDDQKKKRIHFSHYTYIPGFGFYGFGLIHLVGGFAKGATSILRQLVDAGTLSNLPGGFRTRGLRIKGGDMPIAPGEFRDVDVPVGTIRDNIMPLPFKEPSTVLYSLLENIVAEGRRFAAVSDVNVADMQPNAPVGSTLAVLERTLKTMTAIQSRVHAAMKHELYLLMGIMRDNAPAEYEYDARGDEGPLARQKDYGMVEVIPVSDPNASTMSQRIAQYQSALQLAQSAPQIYDLPLLHRQMIETLGIKNADKLIPATDDQEPMDPVSENMALLTGKPVKAFLHQDHDSHIESHMAFGQDPKIQEMLSLQGPGAQAKMAAGMEHINEHLAFKYRQQVEEQLGVQLPPPNQPLPEEAEASLSRLMADAGTKVLGINTQEIQAKQAQQRADDPVVQMQQHEMQVQMGELQRKMKKDEMDHQIDSTKLQIEAAKVDGQAATSKVDQAFKAKKALMEQELETAKATDASTNSRVDQAYKAKSSLMNNELEKERLTTQDRQKRVDQAFKAKEALLKDERERIKMNIDITKPQKGGDV